MTDSGESDKIPVRDCSKIKWVSEADDNTAHKLVKGFVDPDLTNHWEGSETANSHKNDYPELTKEQYAERARELAEMPTSKNVRGFAVLEQNIIVRFDVDTGDFVKAHIHYGIITMFKADAKYYEGQRATEMNHRKHRRKKG